MRSKIAISVMSFAVISVFGYSHLAFAAMNKFIYDANNKKDPFIPLVDKSSPTGLRTVFVPPEQHVELPMDVKISGILWNGKEYFAIVNEKVIKAGDTLGAIRIKGISSNQVIVEYGQREFAVPLREESKK